MNCSETKHQSNHHRTSQPTVPCPDGSTPEYSL
ncbi:unnamed protein product [Enterobius vermicularis]|uniref:Uncharacterized protein n=1 Tax=Enterobius vermicularis TaxID=51028 RepID=A0A0N4VR82_ENTVE|nr:unnamed protein product [Enterobius vermicularis]